MNFPFLLSLHCVCNPVYNIDCCKGCWEHGSSVNVNGVSINGLKERLQASLFVQFHSLLLFCLSSLYFYCAIWSRQASGDSVLPVRNGQFLVHTSYGEGKQNNGILHVDLQRKERIMAISRARAVSFIQTMHGTSVVKHSYVGSICAEWDWALLWQNWWNTLCYHS